MIHTTLQVKASLKRLLPVLLLPALAGCMRLPPDVAAELSAPDGRRPNNYALADGTPAADAGTPAASP